MRNDDEIKTLKQALLENYNIETDIDLIKQLGIKEEDKSKLFTWIRYQCAFSYREGFENGKKSTFLVNDTLNPNVENLLRFTIKQWASLNEQEEPDHEDLVKNWLDDDLKDWVNNPKKHSCDTCNWQNAKHEYMCESCTSDFKNWKQDTEINDL